MWALGYVFTYYSLKKTNIKTYTSHMKSRLGAEDAVQLVEYFLSRHKALDSVYSPREKWVCSCIPVIQISGGRGRKIRRLRSFLASRWVPDQSGIYRILCKKKIVCIKRCLYKVDNCLLISFSILTTKGEEIISIVEFLSVSHSFTHYT